MMFTGRSQWIGLFFLLFSSTTALAIDNVISNYIFAVPGGASPEGVLSRHPVDINANALFSSQIGGTEVNTLSNDLDITLPNGTTLRFNRAFDNVNYNNSNYAHWSGEQLGLSDTTVSLTLAKSVFRTQPEMLSGFIHHDGQSYRLHVDDFGQQIIDVVDSSFPLDCDLDEINDSAISFGVTLPEVGEDVEPVIDIGVLYLPGTSTLTDRIMQVDISAVVNAANTAMENSEADSRLNLVSVERMNIGLISEIRGGTEEQPGPYFGCFDFPMDGIEPAECGFNGFHRSQQVIDFREDNELDLVSFFLGDFDLPGGGLGVAELPNVPDLTWNRCNAGFGSDCAFSMFRESPMLNLVFAHEIGHNIGLFHNKRGNTIVQEGPVIPAARGYVNEAMSNASIMVSGRATCNGIDPCPRLMTYSNPAQDTGVENVADSVNGLNVAWPIVASYRGEAFEPPSEELLPIGTGFSGTWDIASSQNEGIVFQVSPDVEEGFVFGAWFADEGWTTIQSAGPVVGSDTEVTLGIYRNTGGVFNDPTPTTQELVGVARLSFTSCTEGLLRFTFSTGLSGSALLLRSTLPINCDPSITGVPGNGLINDFGLTGAWYEPSTSGQGLVLEVNPANNVFFGGWFTYDGMGRSTWYTIQGGYDPNGDSVSAPIRLVNEVGNLVSIGQATVTFTTSNCLELNFGFDSGSEGVIPMRKVTVAGPCPGLN